MEKISFSPLQEHQLPLLCRWLNRPHLRRHYQPEPIDLNRVIGDYTPQILGLVAIEAFLSHLEPDGPPVGMVQRTRLKDQPRYWPKLGLEPDTPHSSRSWSIDHFVSDPGYFGTGARILAQFVLQFPASYLTIHASDNPRAIAASFKAGFHELKTFEYQGIYYRQLARDTSADFGPAL